MVGVNAIQTSCLVGFAFVLIPVIHADDHDLVKPQKKGNLQRRIGHGPALVHAPGNIGTKPCVRFLSFQMMRQCILWNDIPTPGTDKLDAVHRGNRLMRLLDDFPIHHHVKPRKKRIS